MNKPKGQFIDRHSVPNEGMWCYSEADMQEVVAEVEKLKKDAARYRWMREYLPSDDSSCDDESIVDALTPEELDAAIDAAMENTNEQGN